VPDCDEADVFLPFAEVTLARQAVPLVAVVFALLCSSSESEDDDIAAMRRLFGRCRERVSCEQTEVASGMGQYMTMHLSFGPNPRCFVTVLHILVAAPGVA
jgi:hypothetical protein